MDHWHMQAVSHSARNAYQNSVLHTSACLVCVLPLAWLSSDPASEMCSSNLQFFIDHGLSPSADVLISVIGDSLTPQSPPPNQGVAVHRIPCNPGADPYVHASVLQRLTASGRLSKYSHFAFLNCGTRGPYVLKDLQHCPHAFDGWFSTKVSGPTWFYPYAARLGGDTDVALVGPSISFQRGMVHVQSHFLATTAPHVPMIINSWMDRNKPRCPLFKEARNLSSSSELVQLQSINLGCTSSQRTRPRVHSSMPPPQCRNSPATVSRRLVAQSVVRSTEIDVSQLAIRDGFNLQSLAPYSQGWDYRTCGGMQRFPRNLRFDPQCTGDVASPLEYIFVKFGGSLMRSNRVNEQLCMCLKYHDAEENSPTLSRNISFMLQRSEHHVFRTILQRSV